MIKKILLLSTLFTTFISSAFANPACIVCTAAVGASLTIARKLGIGDNIVGLWAGALFAILGYWLIKWFDKKNWNFPFRNFILMTLSVGMIGFMYISDMTYTPQPIFVFWLDPFLFSSILGAIVLILSSKLYDWMKTKNGGKAHFPFEKVVLPVLALALVSLYLYYYGL
jgi:hypothetical protein